MIGHYLLSLTRAQEDRVLTQPFRPVFDTGDPTARCLCGCATDGLDFEGGQADEPSRRNSPKHRIGLPGFRYEYLARRFGTARVNAAIRNRILSNQARRVLAAKPAVLRGAATPTEPQPQ